MLDMSGSYPSMTFREDNCCNKTLVQEYFPHSCSVRYVHIIRFIILCVILVHATSVDNSWWRQADVILNERVLAILTQITTNKANLRPSNLTPIEFKSSIFRHVWPWNLMDDIENLQGTSFIPPQALCILSKPSVDSNWSYSLKILNSGQNRRFFCALWRMALENSRAPLLCHIKLGVIFHHYMWRWLLRNQGIPCLKA